jgi:hypothetical protein
MFLLCFGVLSPAYRVPKATRSASLIWAIEVGVMFFMVDALTNFYRIKMFQRCEKNIFPYSLKRMDYQKTDWDMSEILKRKKQDDAPSSEHILNQKYVDITIILREYGL